MDKKEARGKLRQLGDNMVILGKILDPLVHMVGEQSRQYIQILSQKDISTHP